MFKQKLEDCFTFFRWKTHNMCGEQCVDKDHPLATLWMRSNNRVSLPADYLKQLFSRRCPASALCQTFPKTVRKIVYRIKT